VSAGDLRVGSRDRRVGGMVKLYLQKRLQRLETTQPCVNAQERARAAQDREQMTANSC